MEVRERVAFQNRSWAAGTCAPQLGEQLTAAINIYYLLEVISNLRLERKKP
jgi:hypothetical protein